MDSRVGAINSRTVVYNNPLVKSILWQLSFFSPLVGDSPLSDNEK